MVKRFDLFLLNLDAEVGRQARNTRPCVVISPDEMNRNLSVVIVAPIASDVAELPTRIPVEVLNSTRSVVLDQLRSVDRERLVQKIGELDSASRKAVLERLQEIFAE